MQVLILGGELSLEEFFSSIYSWGSSGCSPALQKIPLELEPSHNFPLSLIFESCGSINQVGKGANPSFQEPFGPQFRYSSSMTPVPDPCVFIALCEMFSLLRTGQEVTWAPLNLRAVPGSCLYFKG